MLTCIISYPHCSKDELQPSSRSVGVLDVMGVMGMAEVTDLMDVADVFDVRDVTDLTDVIYYEYESEYICMINYIVTLYDYI